jgi:hypothetical protein
MGVGEGKEEEEEGGGSLFIGWRPRLRRERGRLGTIIHTFIAAKPIILDGRGGRGTTHCDRRTAQRCSIHRQVFPPPPSQNLGEADGRVPAVTMTTNVEG